VLLTEIKCANIPIVQLFTRRCSFTKGNHRSGSVICVDRSTIADRPYWPSLDVSWRRVSFWHQHSDQHPIASLFFSSRLHRKINFAKLPRWRKFKVPGHTNKGGYWSRATPDCFVVIFLIEKQYTRVFLSSAVCNTAPTIEDWSLNLNDL
jgi:hypothetical protein